MSEAGTERSVQRSAVLCCRWAKRKGTRQGQGPRAAPDCVRRIKYHVWPLSRKIRTPRPPIGQYFKRVPELVRMQPSRIFLDAFSPDISAGPSTPLRGQNANQRFSDVLPWHSSARNGEMGPGEAMWRRLFPGGLTCVIVYL